MMQTYEHYKESGIDWIGPIPSYWEVKPGFTVLKERKEKNKGMISNNVLSLSYGKIIEKPIEKLTGLVPENFETYQLVYKGDIIFRPTDLQNDKVSLRTGLSKYNGIITSAYINLQPVNSVPRYLHYFLHTTDTNKVIYGLGSGLRQNISFLDFKRFGFVLPPIQEQEAIANFLDEKTAKIDALVQTKEQQIEKLKELRQAKIHQAVTKGIPCHAELVEASSKTHALSKVEMKDSGIEWIGEIPAHWEVKRLKNISFLQSGETISAEQFVEEGYPVYGGNGFRGFANRYTNEGKTILIGRQGALCGNVNYATNKFFASEHAIVVYPLNGENIIWLGEAIRMSDLNRLSQSAAQPGIAVGVIKNEWFPYPSISEQNTIGIYLQEVTRKIDRAIGQKQEQITKLKEYKQSLINDVVTGKVKVC